VPVVTKAGPIRTATLCINEVAVKGQETVFVSESRRLQSGGWPVDATVSSTVGWQASCTM
jgi:hypothetical protein